jgi:hypothetical protein
MLARRVLGARTPSVVISYAAAQRSLNTALGSDRGQYADPTDRANANSYARANNAAGMLAGISFAALTSTYVVVCNSGDDSGAANLAVH